MKATFPARSCIFLSKPVDTFNADYSRGCSMNPSVQQS